MSELEKAIERNRRLARELRDLEREVERARKREERAKLQKLDREAQDMERQIARHKATLHKIKAEETKTPESRERKGGKSRSRGKGDTPRIKTKGERKETTRARVVPMVASDDPSDRENRPPTPNRVDTVVHSWEHLPSTAGARVAWSQVYSSSEPRTPSPEPETPRPGTSRDASGRSRADARLESRPVVRLNRLEEVDPTLILDSRTRVRTSVKIDYPRDDRAERRIRQSAGTTDSEERTRTPSSQRNREGRVRRPTERQPEPRIGSPEEATLLRLEFERRRKAMAVAARKTGFGRIFRLLSDSDLDDDDNADADEPATVPAVDTPSGGSSMRQQAAAEEASDTTLKDAARMSGVESGAEDVEAEVQRRQSEADEQPMMWEAELWGGRSPPGERVEATARVIEAPNLTPPDASCGDQPTEPERRASQPSEPEPTEPADESERPSEPGPRVDEPTQPSAEASTPPGPDPARREGDDVDAERGASAPTVGSAETGAGEPTTEPEGSPSLLAGRGRPMSVAEEPAPTEGEPDDEEVPDRNLSEVSGASSA